MALIDCPECDQQISTFAAVCPKCGFPVCGGMAVPQALRRERGPSRWTDPGFWVIVVGLFVVIVLSIVILRQGGRAAESTTTVPVTTTEASTMIQGSGTTGDSATTETPWATGADVRGLGPTGRRLLAPV